VLGCAFFFDCSDTGDLRQPLCSDLILIAGGALAHVAAWVLLVIAWFADRRKRMPWEGLSIASTAVTCAAYPWLAALVLGPERPELADRIVALAAAAAAAAYATSVPVRIRRWPIVPLVVAMSCMLMSATVGPTDMSEVLLYIITQFVMLAATLGNNLRRERLERRAWFAGRQRGPEHAHECLDRPRDEVSEEDEESHHSLAQPKGGSELSCLWADMAFDMSESCHLLQTCAAVHDRFFGRPADGLCLSSILARPERIQLDTMLDAAVVSQTPQFLDCCTLNLQQGPVRVSLQAAPLGGRFRVGVRVLEETPVLRVLEPELGHGRSSDLPADPARSSSASSLTRFHGIIPSHGVEGAAVPSMGALSELSLMTGRHSDSAVSLAYSEYTVRQTPLTYPVTIATQTEGAAQLELVEQGVNTDIVMSGFSFRCVVCSKPPPLRRTCSDEDEICAPVVPGPQARAIMEKLDRKKGVIRASERAGTDGDCRFCTDPAFDGLWTVAPQHANEVNEWMSRLTITSGRAILGDGSEAYMMQIGKRGPILLRGGVMQICSDDRISRTGKGGRVIEFVRTPQGEGEPSGRSGDRRPCKYTGKTFDGIWIPTVDQSKLKTWIRRVCIMSGHVILGDGTEDHLLQLGGAGPVLLCGGELRLEGGRLQRLGKDGPTVEFVAAPEDVTRGGRVGRSRTDESARSRSASSSTSVGDVDVRPRRHGELGRPRRREP